MDADGAPSLGGISRSFNYSRFLIKTKTITLLFLGLLHLCPYLSYDVDRLFDLIQVLFL